MKKIELLPTEEIISGTSKGKKGKIKSLLDLKKDMKLIPLSSQEAFPHWRNDNCKPNKYKHVKENLYNCCCGESGVPV